MSEDIGKEVRKMYDAIGVHFSRTRQKQYAKGSANWPTTDQYLAKLVPGDHVLDLGCGNGRLISGLPPQVEYTGIDFSKTLIGEARRLYPKNVFEIGDANDPTVWKNLPKFDAIFCVAMLHHIPEKKQQIEILKTAKAHLAKHGFMYLTVWNLWQKKYLKYHEASKVLKAEDAKWVEIPYDHSWKRFCVAYDVASLTEVLSGAGWKIDEIFYADKEGKVSDKEGGSNLVVVATIGNSA